MKISEITYAIYSEVLFKVQLNPEVWDEKRKGLDYTESPPEVQVEDLDIPQTDPSAWVMALRYFAIAALAILLIYIVVRLITNRSKSASKNESPVREIADSAEQPTATSPMEKLYAALAEAKTRADYREAIRIWYQIVVKHLHEKGKLLAAPNKTGREYVRELSREDNTSDFLKITLLHETAWYGIKIPEKSDFERMEPQFESYIKSIGGGK